MKEKLKSFMDNLLCCWPGMESLYKWKQHWLLLKEKFAKNKRKVLLNKNKIPKYMQGKSLVRYEVIAELKNI